MTRQNRVWFITGASSGFGRALAETVLARGERAMVAARRTSALQELVAQHPTSARAVTLDVTSEADRQGAFQQALEHFGRLDVLANIAGRGSLGAAEEFTLVQLREQMEINFFAAVEMTRLVLPIMRQQRAGHILQLTSIGGLAAYQGFAPYCASKFALEGWSEALQLEVANFGIHVTMVEPGAFRTEFAGDKNMRPHHTIAAYRPVIQPIEDYLYGNDGQQPGDPHKAALAMLQAVNSPTPPVRLLLGTDAIDLLEKKQAALQKELADWRQIGEATAFDDATMRTIGS